MKEFLKSIWSSIEIIIVTLFLLFLLIAVTSVITWAVLKSFGIF